MAPVELKVEMVEPPKPEKVKQFTLTLSDEEMQLIGRALWNYHDYGTYVHQAKALYNELVQIGAFPESWKHTKTP